MRLATVLEGGRGRPECRAPVSMDYSFYVEDERVRIVERQRGSPMDKLVSELMILVNSEWGATLAEAGIPAIYRAQGNGKVACPPYRPRTRGWGWLTTSGPARRCAATWTWSTSASWWPRLPGEPPPYAAGGLCSPSMRDFEAGL